jgi:hypothetical protein
MLANNELRSKQQLSAVELVLGIVSVPITRSTMPNSDLAK